VKREIFITADGSSTLYLPQIKEHFHSTFGAVQESMHVFIEAGLKQIKKTEIKIFELGFGSGLNCLLTYLNAENRVIEYTGIETFPLEPDLVKQLNYNKMLGLEDSGNVFFQHIHQSEWGETKFITDKFKLKKIKGEMENYSETGEFDLVYFDAFSPAVQPELWSEIIFQKMSDALNTNGVLVTYCAKGEVRRTMEKCGFSVERIPGPPGKREMLRAIKQ
jgi:tRNA U34 5-methylaminomethyl-2-thiouridine-forming methyltransferase MnmC